MGQHHLTALGLPMTLVDGVYPNVRDQRNTDDMNFRESKSKLDSLKPQTGSFDSVKTSRQESKQNLPLKRFKRDDSENSKTLKMDGKYARRLREQLQIFNNLQTLRKSISAFL
ncbi:uncharacterized protein LOC141853788 [Brevipalpus obovatus]|uniref:uncharacterized protein LOC141853788 n=1 Tax=Brevipalpus obovatus TaxID=246614 RepID=UPI003D9DE4FF